MPKKTATTRIPQDEIDSAEAATEVAVSFLQRYYSWIKPVRATRTNHTWIVEIDVGILREQLARLSIDASTGSITEYDVPKAKAIPGKK